MKKDKEIKCEIVTPDNIHQLDKLKQEDQQRENIYPVTVVEAVFDKHGIRLDHLLSRSNHIYLKFLGTFEKTVLQVPLAQRHRGLLVTYKNLKGECWTKRFAKEASFSDDAWQDKENWQVWDYDSMYNKLIHIIKKEVKDSIKADKYINERIDQEIQDRKDADTRLQNYIDAEIQNRKDADTRLQEYIETLVKNEANARQEADVRLEKYIESLIEAEREARVEADQKLQAYIKSLVDAEEESRKEADALINSHLTTVDNRLDNIDTAITNINAHIDSIDTSIKDLWQYLYDFRADYDETKQKLENLIDQFNNFKIAEVVSELPTTDIKENTLYLVPSPNLDSGELDVYIEYVYTQNESGTYVWEKLGQKQFEVDLSGYVNKVTATGTSPIKLSGSISGNTLTLTSSIDEDALKQVVGGVTSIYTSNTSSSAVADIISITPNQNTGSVTLSYAIDESFLKAYIQSIASGSVDLSEYLKKADAESTYQKKLTPGTNIEITANNVINCTYDGGGGSDVDLSKYLLISTAESTYQKILHHYIETYSGNNDTTDYGRMYTHYNETYGVFETLIASSYSSNENVYWTTDYSGKSGSMPEIYCEDRSASNIPESIILLAPDYIRFIVREHIDNPTYNHSMTFDRNHLYVNGKEVVVEGDGVVANETWSSSYYPSATAKLITGTISGSSVYLYPPNDTMSAGHEIHMIFVAGRSTKVGISSRFAITDGISSIELSEGEYVEISLISDGSTIYARSGTNSAS